MVLISKKAALFMEESKRIPIFPICPLAHSLLGKLTVIVGHCDLLLEKESTDPECANRLRLVREAARSMGVELQDHQCEHMIHQKTLVEGPDPKHA